MTDFTFFWAGIIGVSCLLFYLFRQYSKKKANYWSSRGFATIDRNKVLGSIFRTLFRPKSVRELDALLYSHVKHDLKQPYAGLILFGKPSLIVTDLDLAKSVLAKDSEYFLSRVQFPEIKDVEPFFASILFFMEGEPWKELRSKTTPTFTTGKIRKMFPLLESTSQKLADYLVTESDKRPSDQIDLLDTFGRYTMDTIASVAFGLDAKSFSEENPIFSRMAKKLQFEANFKMVLIFLTMVYAPKLAAALRLAFIDREMLAFFSNVMMSTIKHRETTGYRREDFLQLMLDARSGQLRDDDEGTPKADTDTASHTSSSKRSTIELSDEVIMWQGTLFILAGYDTTQSLLVFAAYELALNPEIQDTLRGELEKIWKKNGGKFTYDTINQQEYLDNFVNEALRKYPPLTRLERRATHDYQIPGTNLVIPKDAQVLLPTFYIQRDEEHFPDPERFNPERFSAENKSTRHPYAFQSFGHGPRNCIGMRFALTNAKMAIASLVHNFRFEPSDKTMIPMQYEKTNFLKPKGGLYLKVTKI